MKALKEGDESQEVETNIVGDEETNEGIVVEESAGKDNNSYPSQDDGYVSPASPTVILVKKDISSGTMIKFILYVCTRCPSKNYLLGFLVPKTKKLRLQMMSNGDF